MGPSAVKAILINLLRKKNTWIYYNFLNTFFNLRLIFICLQSDPGSMKHIILDTTQRKQNKNNQILERVNLMYIDSFILSH
jgi:hypothetical protein